MNYSGHQGIQDFLNTHGIRDKRHMITLVHAISHIPWGEVRTPAEVLEKGKGTCTGKHLLLEACFQALGIPFRTVVCTFRWKEQGLKLPPHLSAILEKKSWEHGHNFVQIQDKNGVWIDLDITWDPPLKPYGFRTFPEDWNGTSPFVGAEPLVRRWEGADISTMKHQLIEELTPDQKEARARFLEGFIKWIDGLR